MTRSGTVPRGILYAICLISEIALPAQLSILLHSLYLFSLCSFTFSFLHPILPSLSFNLHSPQEVASPCPPALLLLPFFPFHIWSGSCGWPGFSGVGGCGGGGGAGGGGGG